MTRQITINLSEITETLDVYSLDAGEKAKIIEAQSVALKNADAEIEKLRAALKPFADRVDDFIPEKHDAHRAFVTLGEIRAAAAALKETGDDNNDA